MSTKTKSTATDKGFTVKDWHKFQHFKDRKPPWIKLYRDILDDPDWHNLDPASAKVLVMLWLIASEDNGHIPNAKTIAFRVRMPESAINKAISSLSHWLIHDDIGAISERHQDDAPETETDKEKEKDLFEEWFEAAWVAFGRYGSKKIAKRYAKAYKPEDWQRITDAIPKYIKCVDAGRLKKQFEGWLNPENMLWEMDWNSVLDNLSKPDRPVHPRKPSFI